METHTAAIGLKYMHATYYGLSELLAEGHGEEGQEGEPLKFKIYRDLKNYPLNQQLPLVLEDARWSFEAYRRATSRTRPQASRLDLALLSCLLYYSYGFSRHDTGADVQWPFHRLVASARCFFPTELYLWTPGDEILPEGLYHYDPLHQSLVSLRRDVSAQLLSRILDYKLEPSDAVLFVSAYFWKNAFRYQNFSYRLCSQEAGMVIGNILAVAGTLGVQTDTAYQFLDQPLARLLGLASGEESPFAAVILSPQQRSVPTDQVFPASTSSAELLPDINVITPRHIQLSTIEREKCASLLEIDQASQFGDTREFRRDLLSAQVVHDLEDAAIKFEPLPQHLELAWALHQRNSGDVLFTPRKQTLEQNVFWEIIRYSLEPYRHDLRPQAFARPMMELYIAVNDVEGMEKGVYRLSPDDQSLQIVERSDITTRIRQIHSTPSVNCATANMICYPVANYYPLNESLGARSYRIMNMECGIVAQRLCLMSAAFNLVARCSDSYHITLCEQLLHLTDQPEMPLFLIAIGHERAGGGLRYRHAIRF